ncbi:hypothetical protein COV49_02300 [Candidatus Falkowbacteria bacterium CG11_big_fil_rev_8_21_14_0_20_39_10]|uniref:Uncharacterized protein n=1 Tax=Candidatus Falkowbacteria bacterium CG11_big_fil_rev_8_21_14_0_20_39_10 TaxID=1974570 RepID=A0A2M6K8Z6_9BACT|nr:MAG: hypothetical protein COV49_02300 [Candidatus Falkowbacteria bacterium CG11_big_fil_rev_8_21_14_0_20_39_10]
MFYEINIKARADSKLSQKELENQLVIALHNVDSQYSKLDGVDDDLEVTDYEITEATPVCENCNGELEYRMFDIDGINLEERLVCEECGFGKPDLK